MKRGMILSMLVAAALGTAAPVKADGLNLSAVKSTTDPLTGLAPEQWRTLAIQGVSDGSFQ